MESIAVCYPDLKRADYDLIQFFREHYDPNYPIIEPHFTIVFPVTDIDTNRFIEHCKEICRHITPISFDIRRTMVNKSYGDDDWYAFLVPDKGLSDIAGLHDRLYTGILEPELRLEIPYIPHITVGRFDNGAECKNLCDRINEKVISIKGNISFIDIITNDQSRLRTIEKIMISER